MNADTRLLETEHVHVERPAGGVFAAIVDLAEETLVLDAFMPRAAAVELTGRSPRHLVNSRGHGDHVGGNAVFLPEAAIRATA